MPDSRPPSPSLHRSSSSLLLSKSKLARALPPTPTNHEIFDPWNTASTGHQRAENPYSNSTAWRDARTTKLARQFRGVPVDSAAAPLERTRKRGGEWRWGSSSSSSYSLSEEATRQKLGCQDIRLFMDGVKKRRKTVAAAVAQGECEVEGEGTTDGAGTAWAGAGAGAGEDVCVATNTKENRDTTGFQTVTTCSSQQCDVGSGSGDDGLVLARADAIAVADGSENTHAFSLEPASPSTEFIQPPQPGSRMINDAGSTTGIFSGTTIYVNGSTMPLISDHKLKHVLATNGAKIAIGLARRTVTHVIVGRPNSMNARTTGAAAAVGAGGGLAAGKLQSEIAKARGRRVMFVSAEWVLESIKVGKRLSEARFLPLHVASGNQRSVLGMLKQAVQG